MAADDALAIAAEVKAERDAGELNGKDGDDLQALRDGGGRCGARRDERGNATTATSGTATGVIGESVFSDIADAIRG